MEPVGERLKKAREDRGLSLGEVAQVTKISITTLTALERGDLTRLPGGIFGRSFVRGYADQVGLDPDEIVRAFAEEVKELERESARAKAELPITPDDREFAARQRRALRLARRTFVLVVVAALVLLVWGIWAWGRSADETGEPVSSGGSARSAVSSLLLADAAPPRHPLRPHL